VELKDDVWDGRCCVYKSYNFGECPLVSDYQCRYRKLLKALECGECETEFLPVRIITYEILFEIDIIYREREREREESHTTIANINVEPC